MKRTLIDSYVKHSTPRPGVRTMVRSDPLWELWLGEDGVYVVTCSGNYHIKFDNEAAAMRFMANVRRG